MVILTLNVLIALMAALLAVLQVVQARRYGISVWQQSKETVERAVELGKALLRLDFAEVRDLVDFRWMLELITGTQRTRSHNTQAAILERRVRHGAVFAQLLLGPERASDSCDEFLDEMLCRLAAGDQHVTRLAGARFLWRVVFPLAFRHASQRVRQLARSR